MQTEEEFQAACSFGWAWIYKSDHKLGLWDYKAGIINSLFEVAPSWQWDYNGDSFTITVAFMPTLTSINKQEIVFWPFQINANTRDVTCHPRLVK